MWISGAKIGTRERGRCVFHIPSSGNGTSNNLDYFHLGLREAMRGIHEGQDPPPDEIFLGLATGSTVLLILLIFALTIVD
jgi:hypothetical protein